MSVERGSASRPSSKSAVRRVDEDEPGTTKQKTPTKKEPPVWQPKPKQGPPRDAEQPAQPKLKLASTSGKRPPTGTSVDVGSVRNTPGFRLLNAKHKAQLEVILSV